MVQLVDSATLPNDRFGYSLYAVVLLAPREQRDMVAKLRETLGVTRATLPGHVTVKGTFYGIIDLDDIDRRIASVALTHRPFRIEFGEQLESRQGMTRVADVKKSPPLGSLHSDLERVIDPISRDADGAPDFHPHLTLYEDAKPLQIERGRSLCRFFDLGQGFLATSMTLVGRAGPAYGGRWVEIKRYRLGV